MNKLKTALLSLFLLILAPSPVLAQIYIDITNVSSRSFPIAMVPLFLEKGKVERTDLIEEFISNVEKDLALMGVFRFIEEKAFLEDPKKKAIEAEDIDFGSWAVLDTLALIKGTYRIEGEQIHLDMRLYDVLLRKQLGRQKLSGSFDKVDRLAHSFANEVLRVLAGERGVFDTQIAFIGSRGGYKELYLMDFNGNNLRKITNHRSIVLSPTWSTDGKKVYFTSFKGGRKPQLFEYDVTTETIQRKASFSGMVIGSALDPLENLIATSLTKDGNSELYLIQLDGAISKRLTVNPDIDVSASFAPDGKEMVFISDRDGSPQVYRMNRDGSGAKRLTFKGRNNTSPSWSPRGDRILFSGMDDDGHFDVFSMNRNGDDMFRLTYDTRNNEEPNWSPDGRLVTFRSNRSGRDQIFVMRPDGSHQRRITNQAWGHTMPKWGPQIK